MTATMIETATCQHCSAVAPADRTMCPSCRRRMRSAAAAVTHTAPAPVVVPVASIAAPTPVAAFAPAPVVARSRFGLAFGASVVIAAVGVATWAMLAATMHARSALVGFAVAAGIATVMRALAPHDRRAPIAIVGLTAISALLGLLASQYELLAQATGLSFTDVVERLPMSKVPHLLTIGTTPMTWVIMALSVYSGLRMAATVRPARAR